MLDESNESIEKPEAVQTQAVEPISPKGIDAMRGALQAEQVDLEKYLEQLFTHRSRMREIGNLPAAEETEAEIKRVDQQLGEIVRKKYRLETDSP